MASKFHYFEKEGAVFRKPATQRHPFVNEVKLNGEWKPYTGDRQAPVYFGDQISAAQAGEMEEAEEESGDHRRAAE